MTIATAFDQFLANVVNLNQTRLDLLDARVGAIAKELQDDQTIGPMYQDHIPQGSWPHRTIIRPVDDFDEFDADFLLLLHENADWSEQPKVYLQQLRAAFKRSSTYTDMVRKKNRCVRIGYANDCHIDVVPHLVLPDGRQVIVNYADNAFEETNPQGFTDWMKEKDDITQGNLRRVIRLMKYVRDFKNTFSCPSVILTTLLGQRAQVFDAAARYADVPTALVSLLEDLTAWLSMYPSMPYIGDPSCLTTSFNHRWRDDQYINFRAKVSKYATWAREAFEEKDSATAVLLWQKLFGSDFRLPVVVAAGKAATGTESSAYPAGIRAPREQFIEDQVPGFGGGYLARIDATVDKLPGFRSGSLRNMRTVGKNRTLRFRLVTDAPEPYEVLWKVRNHGAEAERAGDLRGELLRDEGQETRTETTKYVGRHYIEVYVVKGGRLLASDRQSVTIK